MLALARAPKSRLVDHAYVAIMGERPRLEVPDYALDQHTERGRLMGRGLQHFYDEGAVVAPDGQVPDGWRDDAIRIDLAQEARKNG